MPQEPFSPSSQFSTLSKMNDLSGPRTIGTLTALLEQAVDYAGLFPPARLSMDDAVTNYAAYLADRFAWMLGRFIVPLARLDEFEEASKDHLPGPGRQTWHMSGLAAGPMSNEAERIMRFNEAYGRSHQAVIDTMELKASARQDILRDQQSSVPVTRYYEIPLDPDPEELVSAIEETGCRAKMRTGGVTDDAIPDSSRVVRFMACCIRHGVPYKATAGLHHLIRGLYRLTYEPGSPQGMLFGFLNVFLSGAFLSEGMPERDAVLVLEERNADAFRFDTGGVSWNEHRLSQDAVRRARRLNTIAIGSCSFTEPVDELKGVGLL